MIDALPTELQPIAKQVIAFWGPKLYRRNNRQDLLAELVQEACLAELEGRNFKHACTRFWRQFILQVRGKQGWRKRLTLETEKHLELVDTSVVREPDEREHTLTEVSWLTDDEQYTLAYALQLNRHGQGRTTGHIPKDQQLRTELKRSEVAEDIFRVPAYQPAERRYKKLNRKGVRYRLGLCPICGGVPKKPEHEFCTRSCRRMWNHQQRCTGNARLIEGR